MVPFPTILQKQFKMIFNVIKNKVLQLKIKMSYQNLHKLLILYFSLFWASKSHTLILIYAFLHSTQCLIAGPQFP